MTDQIAELRALADQLRATIAELDERIEARARQIADERRPESAATAVQELLERVDALGEMMRQDMLDRLSEDEGRGFIASISSVTWKSSAAHLLLEICDEEYKEHRKRMRRG